MTDLIQLSDLELAAVAGGAQSNTITQTNTSHVTQTATATNSGAVTASVGIGSNNTAAAAGATASNFALVVQSNHARASNSVSVHIF
jgi:hypothetical protein